MPKKESAPKKVKDDNKIKGKSKRKLIKEKADKLLKWKKENATPKRFFSLEKKEQTLLEETYLIFVQMCPELTWEEFIDHLRKTNNRSTRTKSITKAIIGKVT